MIRHLLKRAIMRVMSSSIVASVVLLSIVHTAGEAQYRQPPVRVPNQVVDTSQVRFKSVAGVRVLSNGRVLVNDVVDRRVVMLEASLRFRRIVADTSPATGRAYGARSGGLVPYLGDTTLFIDVATLSMFSVDPDGRLSRVSAAPSPQYLQFLVGGQSGNPGVDARGRLVFRTGGPSQMQLMAKGRLNGPFGPDSAALVRFDLATRRTDTLAFLRMYAPRIIQMPDSAGVTWLARVVNPLPTVDDWTVLANGEVAIARGQDYHIEFIDATGSRRSGRKIPFTWLRMGDEYKRAYLDSTRALRDRLAARGTPVSPAMSLADGDETRGRGRITTITTGDAANAFTRPAAAPVLYVSPDELPDYQPAFAAGAVRADAEDRIWIRTLPIRATQSGIIYDVIDRTGLLVDRVQVPRGAVVVGFVRGGGVITASRDSAGVLLTITR
jgi:hypothetical protein